MVKLLSLKRLPPKILLMGSYGTGKTLFATTLGKHGRVYDLNNGLLSAVTFKDKFTAQRAEIDVRTCWESDPSKATAFGVFRSYMQSLSTEASGMSQGAIIIDGYTDLAEFSMRSVMAAQNKLYEQPQIQHWGMGFAGIERVLMILRSLPIVVVMIAHTRRIEHGGDDLKFELCTPGQKLPQKIPTYFDEVWFSEVLGSGSTAKYRIKTKSSGAVACRTRANIPDIVDMDTGLPTVLKMMGYDIESRKWTLPL